MVCIECYVIPLVLVALQWIYSYVAKWLGWEVKKQPAGKTTPGASKSECAKPELAAGSSASAPGNSSSTGMDSSASSVAVPAS